jgi:tight adherence protein C
MFESSVLAVPRLIILSIIFLLVLAAVLGANGYVVRREAVRRRLKQLGTGELVDVAAGGNLRSERTGGEWSRLVDAIESRGLSLTDTKSEVLRQRLIAAGYTSPLAPRLFTLIRLVLTLALPAIFLTLAFAGNNPPSTLKAYMLGASLALFGLYAPNLWISAKAARRREEVINGFPDALDLMLVCVESGLGLEAALDRVGREMSLSQPLVSQLLGKVVLELRAGRSRGDALRRMADDVDVEEIRSFSTLLIQSDQLGSSIGQTLRVYAAEMREKRRMRAEEKAHRLPVLLSIPLVACMLPVMIGVLMLPAVIRIIRDIVPVIAK